MEIYVYVHIDKKTQKILYVGKGQRKMCKCGVVYDRAYAQAGRKYNVKDVEVYKVKYFDSEDKALEYEERLTLFLRERGQCMYNNNVGNKLSQNTRNKISKANKGKTSPNKGKKMSEETRKKLSEAKKGTQTGERCFFFGKTLRKALGEEGYKDWCEKHSGGNNCQAKATQVIFPNGEHLYFDTKKECREYLGIGRGALDSMLKSGKPYVMSEKNRYNVELMKSLEGIVVKYGGEE